MRLLIFLLILQLLGCLSSNKIGNTIGMPKDNRCKKEYKFNHEKGQIEYIVLDENCIRQYVVFDGKSYPNQLCSKYTSKLDNSFLVSNYYCIKQTNDDKPPTTKRYVVQKENPTSTSSEQQAALSKPDKAIDTIQSIHPKDESGNLLEEAIRSDTYIMELQSQCSKSYSDMKCIPAGYFIRGSNSHKADEAPEEKIYISEFYMDTYEVTNADFQKCLDAGKCQDCLKTGKCRYVSALYGKPYQRPKQPAVGISWYSARDYCKFRGKRLPTEAEWEKAARGPNGNIYPWGNKTATCKLAIIEEDGRKGCVPKKISPPRLMTTDDVGLREPGIYGLYDMAGNSWEWVNDFYSTSYKKCGDACKGKDPKGPCDGKEPCKGYNRKIVRGGSWWWPASYARGSYRRPHDPKNFPEYHHFGFRCAKD